MRVAIIICSVGRPETLATLLPWIARQSVAPSELVLVVTGPADVPDLRALPEARVLFAERGLPKQRNRGLDAVAGRCDVVLFIDDDYLPTRDMVAGVIEAMQTWPDAAGVTGHLLADGIHKGGVSMAAASRLIASHENRGKTGALALERDLVGLYGCNMAVRSSALGTTRFDERLPLYGWQEDVDFAARLPGEKLRTDAFAGVHCGTPQGRETKGHRLGYSQIANVVYLMRKGSLPPGFAWRLMLRSLLANHARCLRPEPWIDRRGRLRGNWLALWDVLRGRIDPERILELA